MRVVLQITNGPYTGRKISLQNGQVLEVGRTEWSDYAVPYDGEISSRHFSVTCSPSHCRISDLGSSNGTFVNDQQISSVDLQDGDTIRAGRTRFEVQLTGLAPVATPTAMDHSLSPRPSVSPPPPTPTPQVPSGAPASPMPRVPPPFLQAFEAENPQIRQAALQAAVCSRQNWLLDYCRTCPAEDDAAFYLLALLGAASDLDRIRVLTAEPGQTVTRFRLWGIAGHPEVMDELVQAIAGPDPTAALAAAAAFTKITGVQLDAETPLDPTGTPTGDRDTGPVEASPDPVLARQHWQRIQSQFTSGTRWRSGVDVSRELSPDVLAQLDLKSRWEVCLRGTFLGTWQGRLVDLEIFSR